MSIPHVTLSGSLLTAALALGGPALALTPLQTVTIGDAGSHGSRGPARRAPNILVIMLDDVPPYFYEQFGAAAPFVLDAPFSPANKANDPINGTNLFVQAPNLQRLAERGVTFLNAYANSACTPSRASILTGLYPHGNGFGGVPHTDIDPAPAHIILEFGDAPFDVPTLAELVRPAGFRSGHFGKWHLAAWNSGVEFAGSGWSHIPAAGHWDEYKSSFHNPPVPPLPFVEAVQRLSGSHYHWIKNSNGVIDEIIDPAQKCGDLSAEYYTAEIQFNDAKEFVVDAPQPWLASLWPNTDHAIFQDPPDQGVATPEYHLVDEIQSFDLQGASGGTFEARFMGQTTAPIDYDATNLELEAALEALSNIDDVVVDGGPLPGTVSVTFEGSLADTEVRSLLLTNLDLVGAPARLPVETVRSGDCGPTAWHAFQAALEYMDLKLGEVLDALEDSGRLERTMIVFTSDNGGPKLIFEKAAEAKAADPSISLGAIAEALLHEDAGNRFKKDVYEGGTRVPLVIAGAGVPQHMRGTTTDALFHLVDVYPTIAALIGEPAGSVHGVDQGPVLRGEVAEVRDEVLSHLFAPNGDYTPISGLRSKKNFNDIGYSKRLPACGSVPAGRYKIIKRYNAAGTGFDIQLYRLEDGSGTPVDPFELDDLSSDSSYDCQETALETALAALLAS